MFSTIANKVYTSIIIITILISIGILSPFFFYKIFKSLVEANNIGYNRERRAETKYLMKTTKGLLYSFLFFAFAFFPYLTLLLIKDHQSVVPRFIYLYMFLLARSNSIFNPILYATTNSQFKRGYEKIFQFLFCCKRRNQIKRNKY